MRQSESVAFSNGQVQELRKLVAQGEGLMLEFKRKASFPNKIVREMVAFANTKGGILLIGVSDDGTIPGVKYPDEEAHVVRNALKNCKPPIDCEEVFIPIGNSRTVVQYSIPESTRRPHAALTENNSFATYVRVKDQSIKASREVIEITRRAKKQKDIRFHFGEHEKFLMTYLDSNQTITLTKFIELTHLKRLYASKKLVLLVLADVLRITPHERGDLFSLAFKTS